MKRRKGAQVHDHEYILFFFVQVDWFPWGEQAFAKARMEDKPIFLSGSPLIIYVFVL
jgi:hypothetical protein